MLMDPNLNAVSSARWMAARRGNVCCSRMRTVVALISKRTRVIPGSCLQACGRLKSTRGVARVAVQAAAFSSQLTVALPGSDFQATGYQHAQPGRSSLQL